MRRAFISSRILTDGGFVAGHTVVVDGERITPSEPLPNDCEVVDLSLPVYSKRKVMPFGLLHCNQRCDNCTVSSRWL